MDGDSLAQPMRLVHQSGHFGERELRGVDFVSQ